MYTNQNLKTSNGVKKYHPLGPKTLFMFILKRSAVLILLVPILLAGLFSLDYVPKEYFDIAVSALFGYLIFILMIFTVSFLLALLEYHRYWIFIDEKDLKIARGLIAIEQIGVPYRRISDVRIIRSLVDQIFGVSDILLTTLGDDNPDEKESTILLPSLSKEIAIQIQDIVLKKAQVEQVILAGQGTH